MANRDNFLFYHGMKDWGRYESIRINSTGESIPSPNWSWDSGHLKDYDIVLVKQGKGTYKQGEKSWEVMPGSCMLFRRGERYLGLQEAADPVAMTFIHFDVLDGKRRPVALADGELLPLHLKVERFDFALGLIQSVHDSHLGREGRHPDEAGVWLRALLLELRRQARHARWQGAEWEQARRVEEVCSEIRGRIGEPWRLADIASRLRCGPEHAGRLFRKYRGIAPGKFVIQARLEAARALLSSSSLSVGQIAETLGYCDVYTFSRQFKLKTGQSPRAYRHGSFTPGHISADPDSTQEYPRRGSLLAE